MLKLNKRQKNVLHQILLSTAVIGMLCLWGLSINRTGGLYVSKLDIKIDKIDGFRNLITIPEVTKMVEKGLPNDVLLQPIDRLEIGVIEDMLNSDSRIYKAEVFVDVQQRLIVDIVQRRPIMRVMNKQGDQFYLDQKGHFVAKSNYRAVRVPVITGYVESLKSGETLIEKKRLKKAWNIVNEINKDLFLKALVEQIHFESTERIVLIPKVGDDRIVLDYIDELPQKLKNLKSFYKELAKSNSWKKYKEIDISYKNQVAARNSVTP